jgi:hypothetical protein
MHLCLLSIDCLNLLLLLFLFLSSSVSEGQPVRVVLDHGDGWAEVEFATEENGVRKGIVPRNYLAETSSSSSSAEEPSNVGGGAGDEVADTEEEEEEEDQQQNEDNDDNGTIAVSFSFDATEDWQIR